MDSNRIFKNDTDAVLVIGYGRMGGAIVRGWLRSGISGNRIHVVDPNIEESVAAELGIQAYTGADKLPANKAFCIVMLALKPQLVAQFLPQYGAAIGSSTMLVSIAAGITSAALGQLVPQVGSVVRVMPNTPALINQGVMVGCADDSVSEPQKEVCELLFKSLGGFFWAETEAQMDAVTAVSGSGPAYLFHFAECMIEAGRAAGLPDALAKSLAVGTITGAASLMATDPREVADLRREVTSPGGTTEAALNVLMENQALSRLVTQAVDAASKRSLALSSLM